MKTNVKVQMSSPVSIFNDPAIDYLFIYIFNGLKLLFFSVSTINEVFLGGIQYFGRQKEKKTFTLVRDYGQNLYGARYWTEEEKKFGPINILKV